MEKPAAFAVGYSFRIIGFQSYHTDTSYKGNTFFELEIVWQSLWTDIISRLLLVNWGAGPVIRTYLLPVIYSTQQAAEYSDKIKKLNDKRKGRPFG